MEEDDYVEYEEDDPSLRLYLDSADTTEWAKWAEAGIFYGFTTNPSILKRDGVQCTVPAMRNLSRHAFDLGAEELHLQAWGTTMAELYSCGLDLVELDSRVLVKLPMTLEGMKAANRLVADGVPITMTAVYSVHQIATAMALGASYIAPYLGRMNDAGKNVRFFFLFFFWRVMLFNSSVFYVCQFNQLSPCSHSFVMQGLDDIAKMQSIIDMCQYYDGETRLLVASIRSADEIGVLAAEGCNTFTISPAVANQLVADPLTLQAAELFQEHAAEMGAMRDQ